MPGHVPTRLAYEDALVPDVQHFFGVPPPASLARDHVIDRAADWQEVDDVAGLLSPGPAQRAGTTPCSIIVRAVSTMVSRTGRMLQPSSRRAFAALTSSLRPT